MYGGLFVGLLYVDEGVDGGIAEFDGAHFLVGVDYKVVDVVHAGLPLGVAVGGEGEFEHAVAGGAAADQILLGGVLVRPQALAALGIVDGALHGYVGVLAGALGAIGE